MIVYGAAPLVLSVVLALFGARSATRMHPRMAAVLLTMLSVVASLATGLVLGLLAVVGIAETFPGLAPADWSGSILRNVAPIPPAAGLVAAGLVTALATNAVRHAIGVAIQLRAAHRTAAALPSFGELAIAEDEKVFAYAVPGRPGRIVVSSALLRELSPDERRAVLAHERSHLTHHHVVFAQLARLAAAANPLLRPVSRVVDTALERWADADAACAVGDARVVAHAIGAASLRHGRVPSAALGAGGNAVVDRVRFLLEPPSLRRGWCWVLLSLGVLCCLGAGLAALDVRAVIEASEAVG